MEKAMKLDELNKVAQAMVASGKGILAADESSGTIKKRFDAIGVESTEDSRRDYREMLFRSAEGMKHISGVILYDETIWQKAKDGTPLVELIKKAGTIPGIKVDEGTKPLPECPGEVVTVGLDKLADRLPKYYEQGARFAKWRAVIDIGANGIPTYTCIRANVHALARYAALCQAAQIVPIVEPEVLMDGDHDVERCQQVTELVLKLQFEELYFNRVALDAMNKIGNLPWRLTFSYGRALQHAPQTTWKGKSENVAAAQRAFSHRAKMNGLAALGQWKSDLEKKAA